MGHGRRCEGREGVGHLPGESKRRTTCLRLPAATAADHDPWVMDRDGELRLPRELELQELRDDWRQPAEDSLVHKLGFGAEAALQDERAAAKPHYAEQLGIGLEDAELIKEARAAGIDVEAAIHELIALKRSQGTFPDGASGDPERRAAVAALDASAAAVHQTEIRSRSVVVGQGPSVGRREGISA